MLTRLRRLILSGGTSSAPVAVASSPRSALSALPWCLTPLVRPLGKRRGLHDRDDRGGPFLAQRRRRLAATARSSPTSCALSTSSAASSRSYQYCSPVASAALKSSKATSPSSVTSTRSPSRLPCAIPAWCSRSSCSHAAAEHRVGDALGGERAERRAGRGRGDEHRRVGATHAGADEPGRVHVGALGEHRA